MKLRLPIHIFLYSFFGLYLLGATTGAYFTDSAESTGNTFQTAETFGDDAEPLSSSVVINEIMWMGGADTDDEWIELRNMTDEAVDISGWVVEKLGAGSANITILEGQSIPPNGYYVISNYASSESMMSVEPDFVTVSVSLLNGGEQLILKNTADEVIDTANQDGPWFAGLNSPTDNSMERKDPPGDGTDPENWHTSNGKINLDDEAGEFATPKAPNSIGL